MKDDQFTISSGYLNVGDGHSLYYQEWGNPELPVTFYLHGGPGSQCKDKHKLSFNPRKHHIVFHDQRGSGQSTYSSSIAQNTTQNLIEDIERLRLHLNIPKIQLFGYSWGSTLALCYAIAHTEVVTKMLIGGIYLGTAAETNFLYENGGIAQFSPEAWEYFTEIIPKKHQSNKVAYYYEQFINGSDDTKQDHLSRWLQLEASIMSFDTDYEIVRLSAHADADIDKMSGVLVAAHYFNNHCFLPEGFILSNVHKLDQTPIIIVQGRFDGVCPPQTAHQLKKQLGESCHLHIVPSSHAREGAMRETIKAYTWSWL
ncbi:MAG TPA: alpha/beta fold hydrolase [Candidatus Saccharibacteria bacterium]|jgi:proline iminopeptidase|nr:alpha/beta fold hydrolase [Candidatus Saccharibacteria bacterium]